MAESILYRDHLIVVTAQFNRTTKSWIGRADISYDHNGKRESYQLVGPRYVHLAERAAVYFMVYAARNWIEARLASSDGNASAGVVMSQFNRLHQSQE